MENNTLDILVVVDMQNDFINGALGTPEAEQIVGPVADLIGRYETDNVYATRDTHHEDYLSTQEGRKLPVEHCIEGSYGWQIHPDVAVMLGSAEIVDKPTFGSLDLAGMITDRIMGSGEPAVITLVGLCTDICVVSNAMLLKALLPETPIRVIKDCCAGVTPEAHEAALATMASCQIEII